MLLAQTITVGFSYSAKAGTEIKMKSGTTTSITAGKDLRGRALGAVSLDAGKGLSATALGSVDVTAGKGMTVEVTGDHEDSATGTRTLLVGKKLVIRCGAGTITVTKDGDITVEGKNIGVKARGRDHGPGQEAQREERGPGDGGSLGKSDRQGRQHRDELSAWRNG